MKAVLVMDMPKCCDECFMLDDSGDYPMCRLTQEIRGYNFRTRERKMDRCPLKPMSEKDYEVFLGSMEGSVLNEYNEKN